MGTPMDILTSSLSTLREKIRRRRKPGKGQITSTKDNVKSSLYEKVKTNGSGLNEMNGSDRSKRTCVVNKINTHNNNTLTINIQINPDKHDPVLPFSMKLTKTCTERPQTVLSSVLNRTSGDFILEETLFYCHLPDWMTHHYLCLITYTGLLIVLLGKVCLICDADI